MGNGTADGSQVELQQKEGHPTVRVFDRAVEDVQGRSTVGGSDRASGVMGDSWGLNRGPGLIVAGKKRGKS